MVLIDTVYQRVLALANKEQRGYITPQEFNLFADQAQHEIFDQYFYDINQYNRRTPEGDIEIQYEYSDLADYVDEKLSPFKRTDPVNVNDGRIQIPSNAYRIGAIHYQGNKVMRVTQEEYNIISKSRFTRPSSNNPMCIYSGEATISNGMPGVNPYIKPAFINKVNLEYIVLPTRPKWGYVVINDKALYDPTPTKTVNFDLHASEETELVYKILKLAGVAIQRKDVLQAAAALEQAEIAQQKL
tara:strand:+ start:137 stop:865 length:729 start_codon:yes stop_codon:yes gene_type:complete